MPDLSFNFFQVNLVDSLWFIVGLVAQWWIFKKMGREGWEGVLPLYNLYVLFEVLYGKGWKFLLFLIPLYNIYLLFKVDIELAHRFGRTSGFGVGLVFLTPIFKCILAFSDSQYNDPTPKAQVEYEF